MNENSRLPVSRAEDDRLRELASFRILDTPPEQAFDDIALLATLVTKTPMAMVTLVDAKREWFKSKIGIRPEELPRYVSFCSKAIESPHPVFIVEDAFDSPMFAENPLVTDDPRIRFYAGVSLVTRRGYAIGTLCVLDHIPRTITDVEVEALRALARQVLAQLELRLHVNDLSSVSKQLIVSHSALEARQGNLAHQNAKLQLATRIDALTGASNRGAFDSHFAQVFKLAQENADPLSLIMLDIDNFKIINDECGHQVGDRILRSVSGILLAGARRGDFVARYGGEEFAVVCPGISESRAWAVADRLRLAVQASRCDDRSVTLSAGVAALSLLTTTTDQLIEAADRALYRAKGAGRNQVVGSLSSALDSAISRERPRNTVR